MLLSTKRTKKHETRARAQNGQLTEMKVIIYGSASLIAFGFVMSCHFEEIGQVFRPSQLKSPSIVVTEGRE